jgi:hypothetical protein
MDMQQAAWLIVPADKNMVTLLGGEILLMYGKIFLQEDTYLPTLSDETPS